MRGGTLVLDPFAGGAPQSEDELRSRVKRVIPDGVADNLPAAELPLDQFLEPATNRQILSRVLRNLKGIYRETDKPERMLDVLNRMLLVTPDASAELRDRGLDLPPPRVLPGGAAGPYRLRRARARRARPRRSARQAVRALRALRAAELGKRNQGQTTF